MKDKRVGRVTKRPLTDKRSRKRIIDERSVRDNRRMYEIKVIQHITMHQMNPMRPWRGVCPCDSYRGG